MKIEPWLNRLRWLPGWLRRPVEKLLRCLPGVDSAIARETDKVIDELRSMTQPYRKEGPRYLCLPESGVDRGSILEQMESLRLREEARWRDGFVSGAVYHGDPEHIEFLNQVYAINSQTNPLHSDVWPSINLYEAQIIAMTSRMLGAPACDAEQSMSVPPGAGPLSSICGSVSSGGTESILLAMKAYRDRGRAEQGIVSPEMVVPVTAHAAFHKAAEYFGMRMRRVEVGDDYRARIDSVRRAINSNTVVVVGSAVSFPHGLIDPIEELSELSRSRGIGFHTDACLGGFVLPWARRIGYPVPPFDFELPGVTSISVDTHKYGYAAKGSSVILYRSPQLRRYQYYTTSDWPGGLYFSPTFAGSRSGALSAMGWAAMVSMGESGYMDATRRILDAAKVLQEGIRAIPELTILGNPLWVTAFASDAVDVYKVMDAMTQRGWCLNGLHKPACVHIAPTLRHTEPGVARRFCEDLAHSVRIARESPDSIQGVAPIYGMAGTMPLTGVVDDMLRDYMDVLYEP